MRKCIMCKCYRPDDDFEVNNLCYRCDKRRCEVLEDKYERREHDLQQMSQDDG